MTFQSCRRYCLVGLWKLWYHKLENNKSVFIFSSSFYLILFWGGFFLFWFFCCWFFVGVFCFGFFFCGFLVFFLSKEALANAKTDELFFLNSSHHCKTQWRIMSVEAFHHFLRQANGSKYESSDVWNYNFYCYDNIYFIMAFLVKIRSWWNLAFWLHLSHEKVNRGGGKIKF